MTTWRGLVVADDFTGAMDTGHAFAARGHRVVVSLGSEDPTPGDVLVVDTDSRYASPDAAARRVTAAIERRDAERTYKKVDSTLRGNLVAETDAALAATGRPLGVVAPAFPRTGRTTACGYHLVDGTVVTDTAAARDPNRPVESAHLGERLDDSRFPTEHVGIGRVARDTATLRDDLRTAVERHADPVLVSFDSTHESHLARVADASAASGTEPLYVGSGGLAAHVSLPAGPETPTAIEPEGDRVLGVAGSTHPRTLAGLSALPAEHVVAMDVTTAVTRPREAAGRAASTVAERFEDQPAVVIASALENRDVDEALAAARRADISPETARERIETALASAVARLQEREPPTGLVLTGGAVATAVLAQLDTDAVELTGRAVDAGVPVGQVSGGAADGTPVITKAGGFGTDTTIMSCLAHLHDDA